jgi:ABC-type cobalamin/Fe3+-siderophores transport system ATPase subunit
VAISFWIETVTFSGGKTVTLSPDSITIIVGPNNSGKTSTLRELSTAIAGGQPGPVVTHLEMQKRGDSNDVKEWLDQNATKSG